MNKELLSQLLEALNERKLTLKAIAEYALNYDLEINSRTFQGAIQEIEALIEESKEELEIEIDSATVSNVSYINALDDKEYFDRFDCSCRTNYNCYITLRRHIFDWDTLKYNDCFHDGIISFEINPFLDKHQIRDLINDLIDIYLYSIDGSKQSIELARSLIYSRSFSLNN